MNLNPPANQDAICPLIGTWKDDDDYESVLMSTSNVLHVDLDGWKAFVPNQ